MATTIVLTVRIGHSEGANLDQNLLNYGRKSEVPSTMNHLNIGVSGVPPNFFVKDGEIGGTDMLLIKLLAKKLNFSFGIKSQGANPNALVNMVIQITPLTYVLLG